MRKFAGLIAAISCASVFAVSAGAQGVVNDVIDGAENVVNDAGNAVEDIIDGGNPTVTTDDADIPDEIEDDAAIDNDNAGKDESYVPPTASTADSNPSTGVSSTFLAAGLVLTGAASVAYLARRRDNGGLTR